MNKFSSNPDTLAGHFAILAGTAFAAGGVTQLIHTQRHAGSQVTGIAGHVVLAFLVVALLSVAPSFMALARHAPPGIAAKAAIVAAIGTTVLALTCITSIVSGHDLSLFNVVAPLTNAAWLFCSIILAVSLKRRGEISTAVAAGLPISWVAVIPLATIGGGVIAGAYYLIIGYLLITNMIEPAGRPPAEPTSA